MEQTEERNKNQCRRPKKPNAKFRAELLAAYNRIVTHTFTVLFAENGEIETLLLSEYLFLEDV